MRLLRIPAIVIASICFAFTVQAVPATPPSGLAEENAALRRENDQLRRDVDQLKQRIRELEGARLRVRPIPPDRGPRGRGVVPPIPRPLPLPEPLRRPDLIVPDMPQGRQHWQEREFNGMKFYIVPLRPDGQP